MEYNHVPKASCVFIAELVDLLKDFPADGNVWKSAAIADRLEQLEYEARWCAASEMTLAAIQGARVLIDINGTPNTLRTVAPPGSASLW